MMKVEDVEEKKVEVKPASIDKDVLDTLRATDKDILAVLGDDKLSKRMMLNCFCELLSEIKGLRSDFDEFMQMLSVCSADKMTAFFKELEKNVKDEENRIELQEKMKESHKKSQKSAKNVKNVVKFPSNDVK